MSEFKGTKSAANYIETEFGTSRFARAITEDDAQALMDLIQEFSNYNLKESKAPEMLEILKMVREGIDTMDFAQLEGIYSQMDYLIRSAEGEL